LDPKSENRPPQTPAAYSLRSFFFSDSVFKRNCSRDTDHSWPHS